MPRGISISDAILEEFFGLVHDRPFLFDKRQRGYRDIIKTKNAWTSIAKSIGLEGMTAKRWQTRWKSNVDTYVRERKKEKASQKSGNGADQLYVSTWKFIDILAFFDEIKKENKKTKSNLANSESDSDGDEEDMDEDQDDEDRRDTLDDLNSGDDIEVDTGNITINTLDSQESQESQEDELPTIRSKPTTPSTPVNLTTPKRNVVAKAIPPKKLSKKETKKSEIKILQEMQEGMLKRGTERRELIVASKRKEKTEHDKFFGLCAMKCEKLNPAVWGVLQHQISTLILNAQNPNMHPIPIIPLPPVQPQEPNWAPIYNPQSNTQSQPMQYTQQSQPMQYTQQSQPMQYTQQRQPMQHTQPSQHMQHTQPSQPQSSSQEHSQHSSGSLFEEESVSSLIGKAERLQTNGGASGTDADWTNKNYFQL